MKKIIALMVTVALLLTSTVAFASRGQKDKEKENEFSKSFQTVMDKKITKFTKETNEEIKKLLEKSRALAKTLKETKEKELKLGVLKLPVAPIQKGLGGKVSYDPVAKLITITKDSNLIVFDLKSKKVFVNGVEDPKATFLKNNKLKRWQVMKYIAENLGYKVEVYDETLFIFTPNGTVTPTPVPSGTPTPVPTGAIEATPTPTPVPTVTPTPEPTVTPTPEPTPTTVPTPTP